MKPRLPYLTVAGVACAVSFGCVHALVDMILERRYERSFFPKAWKVDVSDERLDGITLAIQEEAAAMGLDFNPSEAS